MRRLVAMAWLVVTILQEKGHLFSIQIGAVGNN
jgi:hypothetical protein